MAWPLEEDWPPYFDEWPRQSQVTYLMLRWERHELMYGIAALLELESVQNRDLDPSTARFYKEELAELMLALLLGPESYTNQPDQQK